jgi:hypothetical protein
MFRDGVRGKGSMATSWTWANSASDLLWLLTLL